MKTRNHSITSLILASAVLAGNAFAGTTTTDTAPAAAPSASSDSAVSYVMHGGYGSEYIFRGVDLGNNLCEMGLDASTELNGWGLSAGIWASEFDAPAPDDLNSEMDFYGAISKDLGFATASVGYIYYWNVGSLGIDNQEVSFGLSRDLGFANATLTYYWDVDSTAGGDTDGYTELGLTRSFELGSELTLNLGTNVGYLTEGGDFTAWTTKASLDWAFTKTAKLSPFVTLAVALGESSNSAWVQTDNELVSGALLSVSF